MIRTGWWVIALLTIALNLYSLYQITLYARQPCLGPNCFDVQLTPQNVQALQAVGVSLSTYSVLVLVQMSISFLAWCGMGLFLFFRKPDDRVVLFISLALITFGSAAFGPINVENLSSSPVLAFLIHLINLIGQLGFIFFYIFPDGRFYPRWIRFLALAWAVSWLPALFIKDYAPFTYFPPFFLVLILSVVVAQVMRYVRNASPLQRQQVKWVVFSIVVAFVYFLLYLLVQQAYPNLQSLILLQFASNLLLYLVMAFIPISVGIAMLRYRLWDIDILIRRTLVYGALTLLLGLLYFGSVILFQQALRLLTGAASPVAVVFSTLAIAALFSPVRQRLQQVIDQRFYRRKYDAQQIIDGFGSASRSEVDLKELSSHLLSAVDETLQPEHASLWIKSRS